MYVIQRSYCPQCVEDELFSVWRDDSPDWFDAIIIRKNRIRFSPYLREESSYDEEGRYAGEVTQRYCMGRDLRTREFFSSQGLWQRYFQDRSQNVWQRKIAGAYIVGDRSWKPDYPEMRDNSAMRSYVSQFLKLFSDTLGEKDPSSHVMQLERGYSASILCQAGRVIRVDLHRGANPKSAEEYLASLVYGIG